MLSQVYIFNNTIIHNIIFRFTFSSDFKQLLLSSNRTTKDYVNGYWSYTGSSIIEWWFGGMVRTSLPLSDSEHLTLWKEAIELEPKLKELVESLT